MSWRLTAKEFKRNQLENRGEANRRAMKKIVAARTPPGLLAYDGQEPIGWISLGPRADFVRLANSRTLAPVDDQPVWSVICFFIRKDRRKQGLSGELLKAAAKFAKQNGARILEGYPHELKKDLPPVFVWTGLISAFRKAGFDEALRRSASRPIMRLPL